MIQFLETLTSIFNWSYAGVFFWMIHTFLPLRKNRLLRIAAFFASSPISFMIIYSNDLALAAVQQAVSGNPERSLSPGITADLLL